ncbi:hypothetical protein SAMN06265348_106201 [Pedobacter westerhofensis]|uniref:Uncharacterized protein n=1 Tax=Pedobacter westerhofensis TaxID=425512 RepID=A0A521DU94_9SPHI|nr:hypothetical protein SAMN06265348_106201 [Pedobacter westerhofensis]
MVKNNLYGLEILGRVRFCFERAEGDMNQLISPCKEIVLSK